MVIGAIKDKNWHAIVETYNDVTYVVKLLISQTKFEKTSG